MEIKKFNFFEDYKEAIQAIKDLRYILEDEGIRVSINGPHAVQWHVYFDKVPSFIYISIYKGGSDAYDIQYSEEFSEFMDRLREELEDRFNIRFKNDGNLLYKIVEIVSKKQEQNAKIL